MTARSEPLRWLQLIGLGAIPLELLLVLLLLAGSDPGPFPGLELVLTWAFGAVGPSVLLWRMAPDPFSLLLICTPVRLRTPDQLGFSQQPMGLPLKLLLASGTAFLLPLLWWLDTTSVLATSYALLPTPNRVAALVAVAPLLTLMVWQWQQVLQASLLLGRHIDRHQGTPLAELAPLRGGYNSLAHQVVEGFIKPARRRAGQAVAVGPQGGQGRGTRRRQLGGQGRSRPDRGLAAAGAGGFAWGLPL